MVKIINGLMYRQILIVGDIHGCYTKFMNKLKSVGFDQEQDLVICTGDLVDRGYENEKCVALIDEPWFESVVGNHEIFCMKGFEDYRTEFYHKMDNNGGAWFYQRDRDQQEAIVDKFKTLPVMIEVQLDGLKFGVVHADLPYQDWEHSKAALECGDKVRCDNGDLRTVYDYCTWSRDTIRRMDRTTIAQVDKVFFGHTVSERVLKLGNKYFLDTGAVFGGDFSIYKIKHN